MEHVRLSAINQLVKGDQRWVGSGLGGVCATRGRDAVGGGLGGAGACAGQHGW